MKHVIATFLTVILMSGCGSMPKDRAVSGAGIGAAAGTVVGAVTGLSLLNGAALGATAGALTGVLTSDDEINFGKPAWKRGTKTNQSAIDNTTVARIQHELATRGYDVGSKDGVMGPKTRNAIKDYQEDNGLLVDGRATSELLAYMRKHD